MFSDGSEPGLVMIKIGSLHLVVSYTYERKIKDHRQYGLYQWYEFNL